MIINCLLWLRSDLSIKTEIKGAAKGVLCVDRLNQFWHIRVAFSGRRICSLIREGENPRKWNPAKSTVSGDIWSTGQGEIVVRTVSKGERKWHKKGGTTVFLPPSFGEREFSSTFHKWGGGRLSMDIHIRLHTHIRCGGTNKWFIAS
jgi:hypothetical protein